MNPVEKILGKDISKSRTNYESFLCDKCKKTIHGPLNYGTGWNLCDDCTNSKDLKKWVIKKSKKQVI